ncbi:hypothetical protein Droror1_Dr00019092, partial [Drosera rotundifolia]
MMMKRLSDDLALANHPLATKGILTYILVELGPEYDSLVTVVSSQSSLTLENFYPMLLVAESRILHHQSPTAHSSPPQPISTPQIIPPAANYSSSPSRGHPSFTPQGCGRSSRGRGPHPSLQPCSDFPAPPSCQICHKSGHTAQNCWWHYELSSSQSRYTTQPQSHN